MKNPIPHRSTPRTNGPLQIDGDIVSLLQLPASDKKILAINLGFEYCLARVDGQLKLDTSFGPNGTGYLEDTFAEDSFGFPAAATVTLKGDKVLVIGAFFDLVTSIDYLALARYDQEGNVDGSFGNDGKVIVELPAAGNFRRARQAGLQRTSGVQIGRDAVMQADGKILFFFLEVSEEHRDGRAFLIRLTAEGELDLTFNGQGFKHVTFGGLEINPKGVWVQDDQKLLIYGGTQPDQGGTSTALIGRFNADGTLDRSFNSTGYVAAGTDGVVSRFSSLLIDSSDRIVAIGNDDDRLLMVRRLANGEVDSEFNAGEVLMIDLPEAVVALPALQAQDDALVIAGTCYSEGENRGLLLRLTAEGTVDSSFADGTGYLVAEQESEWFDLAIEADGQIVTAGYAYDRGYQAWIMRVGQDG